MEQLSSAAAILSVNKFLKMIEKSKNKRLFEIDLHEETGFDLVDYFKTFEAIVKVQEYKKVINQEFANNLVASHAHIRNSFTNYIKWHVPPTLLQYYSLSDMYETFIYEEDGCLDHGGRYWGRSKYNRVFNSPMVATPEYIPKIMMV